MPKTACYCRVSTEDQELERQIEATQEYARSKLGVNLKDIEVYRDKSTGTNTERSGYKNMIQDVENGVVEAVVTKSVSRISRSIRDLDRTVERLVKQNEASLYIVDEGFELVPGDDDPYQKAMLRILGVFAELEADMAQKRVKEGIAVRQKSEDYHHGPAPLGFEKDDGHLVEADNYDQVVTVLEMVSKDEMSKRKAAEELDTSRKSIIRSLEDRPELYGL